MKTIAVLAALCGIVFTAQAWDSRENNIWLEGGLKGKIADDWTIQLSEQVRYKEDGFNDYYRHTEACLLWKFRPGWSLAPAFRYVTATKSNVTTSTPTWHLNLAHSASRFGVQLKSRARV
ncbi:hypothetical protein, partial [Pontiella sp.]